VPKNNLQILALDQIFRSTEKCQKFWSTDYENFDQLIKHNFDQLIFGQTTPCPYFLVGKKIPLLCFNEFQRVQVYVII
jgi:hypothetical protein